jgi:hypothetical protein
MRVVSGRKYNIILLLVCQNLIITYILLEINLQQFEIKRGTKMVNFKDVKKRK